MVSSKLKECTVGTLDATVFTIIVMKSVFTLLHKGGE